MPEVTVLEVIEAATSPSVEISFLALSGECQNNCTSEARRSASFSAGAASRTRERR